MSEPLEPLDQKCPCCDQPVTATERVRIMGVLARANETINLGREWCRDCGGVVPVARAGIARPVCYDCVGVEDGAPKQLALIPAREPVVPEWAGMDDFPGSDFD